MGEPQGTKSFWTTLPGILTALAALATAVGGCITIVISSPVLMNVIFPASPSPTVAIASTPPTDTPIPITDTPLTPTNTPVTPTVQPDMCEYLLEHSLNISQANGFKGVIGPSGISLVPTGNGNYTFTTVAAYFKEQLDSVSGSCQGNTLTFTRTRPKSFTQDYQAVVSQNSVNGSVTDRVSHQSVNWSGQIVDAYTPGGLCEQLAGQLISIKQVNGFQGIIGPAGILLIVKDAGVYSFTTTAVYTNEKADPVVGNCQGNTLTFTRTRTNAFIQDFQASISRNQSGGLLLTGSVTDRQTAQSVKWSGKVGEP